MTKKEFENQIKRIETRIKMNPEEYNRILDSKIEEKIELNKLCESILYEYLENHNYRVFNKTKTKEKKVYYGFEDGEKVISCFSPDPFRKELPANWFLTSTGKLLIVYVWDKNKPSKNVYLVLPDEIDKQGRGAYRFKNDATESTRVIKSYFLSVLLFGDKPFDKYTQKLIDLYGSCVFGGIFPEDIQCHHKLSVKEFPQLSYIPENVQILQKKQHENLTQLEIEIRKLLNTDTIKKWFKKLIDSFDFPVSIVIHSDLSVDIERYSFELIEDNKKSPHNC